MLKDILGPARVLIVVVTVILAIRDLVRVSHEPLVIRYVLLLREILDIEVQVNHILLVLALSLNVTSKLPVIL